MKILIICILFFISQATIGQIDKEEYNQNASNDMVVFVTSITIAPGFSFGQVKKSARIQILSVNFSATVFAAVSCEKYEEQLAVMIETNDVTKIDSIQLLENYLDHLEFAKKSKPFDVRAKIFFTKKNEQKLVICMNQNYVSVDGRLIKNNPEFMQFLRSLIPKKQFYY